MKYIFLIVASFLTALLFFAFGRKKQLPNVGDDEPMDGGVRKDHTNVNAPKHIVSDEIVNFYCEISTLAFDSSVFELAGYLFKFKAILGDNNIVHCVYEKLSRFPHDEPRIESFDTDVSFMKELQKLVRQFDLAKHNGISVHVSGLPNHFGALLNIKYASGEYIYAEHNQSCFIKYDAIVSFNELFCKQTENK